jgi:archaeosine-15-forming tRNA-guanine transglycosylase
MFQKAACLKRSILLESDEEVNLMALGQHEINEEKMASFSPGTSVRQRAASAIGAKS